MKRAISVCIALLAAATAQAQQPAINPLGTLLTGRSVYGLDAAHGNIYAAADTAGIFYHDPNALTPFGWTPLGLEGKHCREVAVHPADPLNILVALDLRSGWSGPAEVIYRTTNGGLTWELSQSGIAITSPPVNLVRRLRFHPSDPSRVVLAAQGFGSYISSDTGKSWQKIEGLANYTVNDIIWDASRPGTLFAGGENMIFSAVLLKSTDWGATWTSKLDLALGGDNAIDGIAISPSQPDVMTAGTEGYILRSTDAGEHWTIAAHPERYYFFGVAWDYASTSRVFVAGGNHPPNTGGIYASNDAGATWNMVAQEPKGTIQRAVTSPAFPGYLIFSAGNLHDDSDATGENGVFLLAPEVASVPDTREGAEAWFDGRTIHLSAAGEQSPLRWELYDLLGNPVLSGAISAGETGEIGTEGLATGRYLLRYGGEEERRVMRMNVGR